ncbi:MAG: MBL fold metallo-hydrolase [Deltaproteobacteria bacterium]|nr:MBL fold metallo-hydrolase [Deltaproteobacteria bacterium]MCB9487570.1 MBL fold metallo-hydrolase [Deltaproteobacteria bacterium]
MARIKRRLAANVDGDFYVDSNCIDCGTCYWMAPATFKRRGERSHVYHQPEAAPEVFAALKALTACPTASIGTLEKHDMDPVIDSFPDPIEGNVYHCGFHSRHSFGGASYLIVREGGNVLVDSPSFNMPLVRRIEAMGGVKHMFLTHKDDIAEHQRYADHFGCERIMHAEDITISTEGVERKIENFLPVKLADDLIAIPTPGHTEGSMCLLYDERFLFSGDHAAWDEENEMIVAFDDACWYDWARQTESMRILCNFKFEWILPGHGRRVHLDAEKITEAMRLCVLWMRRRNGPRAAL